MVVMTFKQALAVAQAALFFGTAFAGKISLTNRAVSNTTSSTTPAITSPPVTTASGVQTVTVSGLNMCFNGGIEWADCTNNAIDIGFYPYDSNPYNTSLHPYNIVPANPSIASYCASLWTSSASAYFKTAPITSYTQTGDVGINETVFIDTFSWVPTATQCCLNCTIMGGAIQVMVWPTPAPVPAVTTLVDKASNYTFVSPSVYVVFESIGATNLCGEVGTTIINKTLAFDPDELSTQRNFFAATSGVSNVQLNEAYCAHATPIPGDWSTFDYAAAERGVCTDITTSWWSYYASNDTTMYTDYSDFAAAATADISCGLGCLGQPIQSFTCLYNPCSPFVSVPTQVYNLDPLYNTCVDGIKAFFDPPYTLTQGGSLVAFSSVPASSSTASPVGSPQPVLPSPTSTPTPVTPTPTPSSTPVDPSPSTSASPAPVETSTPADPGTSGQQVVDPNTSAIISSNSGIASTPTTPSDPTSPQVGNSPSSSPATVVTIGSVTASQVSSNVVIGGSGTSHTLTAGGGGVTIGGTTFSLDPSTSLVVDGSTTALVAPTTPAPIGTLTTANGQTGLVVGSQTITPGAPAVTISGTTISLASSGGVAVINGATTSLAAAVTAGPSLVTTSGATHLVVGSQTLLPGSSAVIVGGTTYSLATSGNALVVDGTSEYLIASQTLVAGGPAITISGTVVSLQSGGQSVVVGGSTEAISSFVAATTSGLGGAIVSIGGFATTSGRASTTGYNGTTFTGAASRRELGSGVAVVVWGACLGAWLGNM